MEKTRPIVRQHVMILTHTHPPKPRNRFLFFLFYETKEREREIKINPEIDCLGHFFLGLNSIRFDFQSFAKNSRRKSIVTPINLIRFDWILFPFLRLSFAPTVDLMLCKCLKLNFSNKSI